MDQKGATCVYISKTMFLTELLLGKRHNRVGPGTCQFVDQGWSFCCSWKFRWVPNVVTFGTLQSADFQVRDDQPVKPMQIFQKLKKIPKHFCSQAFQIKASQPEIQLKRSYSQKVWSLETNEPKILRRAILLGGAGSCSWADGFRDEVGSCRGFWFNWKQL